MVSERKLGERKCGKCVVIRGGKIVAGVAGNEGHKRGGK